MHVNSLLEKVNLCSICTHRSIYCLFSWTAGAIKETDVQENTEQNSYKNT